MSYWKFEFNNGTYDGELVVEAESAVKAHELLTSRWPAMVEEIVYRPSTYWSGPELCHPDPEEATAEEFAEFSAHAGEVLGDLESEAKLAKLRDYLDELTQTVQMLTADLRSVTDERAQLQAALLEVAGNYERLIARVTR